MGKAKKKLETVFLVCEETGDYNYTLRRRSGGEKLKLKKYCPRLRKHTPRRRSRPLCHAGGYVTFHWPPDSSGH